MPSPTEIQSVDEGARPPIAPSASGAVQDARSTAAGLLATSSPPESAESAAVVRYRADYWRLPDAIKARCPWTTIMRKLRADQCEKFRKAMALQGHGTLFSIDEEVRALFKDSGTVPIKYGWDREHQLVQIDGDSSEQMATVVTWADASEIEARVAQDGYELFERGENGWLSEPMQQAAACNPGKFFIGGKTEKRWLECLLKGDYYARFYPTNKYVRILPDFPEDRRSERGVMRLLRV